MMRRPRVSLGVLLLPAVLACGYRLANTGTEVPASAQTIRVELFKNGTRERGVEVALQRAIEEEFRRHGTLRVVRDPDADLVLRGAVKNVRNQPVAFTGADEAVAFQSRMTISVRLLERASGRVLVDAPAVQETTDFGAVRGVVIGSSPRFQQETRDAKDLAHLTNVSLTEGQRASARGRLVELLAREVYVVTMEDF
jgi:hypothetical protein